MLTVVSSSVYKNTNTQKNELKKNELKKNELKRILKTHKKMDLMSKLLLEKIETNNDLNINNDFYVYKYFELQRRYVQIERKIKELNKDIDT